LDPRAACGGHGADEGSKDRVKAPLEGSGLEHSVSLTAGKRMPGSNLKKKDPLTPDRLVLEPTHFSDTAKIRLRNCEDAPKSACRLLRIRNHLADCNRESAEIACVLALDANAGCAPRTSGRLMTALAA